jgi:1,4-dihydroxy-2-naphthoate octaprenyltransferase
MVFKYINNYNDALDNKNDKIVLIPNLFATKAGRNLILGLSILLFICLVVQIIYVPKSIPALLFTGISFYLIILAQRKKDIELKKKLR